MYFGQTTFLHLLFDYDDKPNGSKHIPVNFHGVFWSTTMSRKGSKGSKTEVASYEVGDIVLGKVRGYPPWPGRVSRKRSIYRVLTPRLLILGRGARVYSQRRRQRTSAFQKGCSLLCSIFPYWRLVRTSHEDLVNSTYCLACSSWLNPKDISKLKPNEVESYIADHTEGKRSGDLLQGYKIARDPTEWAQDLAEKAAAKAEEEEARGDIDEEDELVDDGERPAGSKKRKAPNASASTATKKRKRNSEPGTTTKTKGAGKGRKSKAAIESEDEEGAQEAQAASKSAPTASPPPLKRTKTTTSGKEENPDDGQLSMSSIHTFISFYCVSLAHYCSAELSKDPEATKVREWRHKLQKVFLSSKVQAPKADDMPDMNDLFTQIETYDKINIAYLSVSLSHLSTKITIDSFLFLTLLALMSLLFYSQFSKIGKVMRHITALSDDKVPLDSQYKFRDRAKVLVERWQHIINASRVDGKDSSKPFGKDSGFGSKNSAANGIGSKNSPGASQSPAANNGTDENMNGIADAINTSIATGTMEVDDGASPKVNGNGHVNGGKGKGIHLHGPLLIFRILSFLNRGTHGSRC